MRAFWVQTAVQHIQALYTRSNVVRISLRECLRPSSPLLAVARRCSWTLDLTHLQADSRHPILPCSLPRFVPLPEHHPRGRGHEQRQRDFSKSSMQIILLVRCQPCLKGVPAGLSRCLILLLLQALHFLLCFLITLQPILDITSPELIFVHFMHLECDVIRRLFLCSCMGVQRGALSDDSLCGLPNAEWWEGSRI